MLLCLESLTQLVEVRVSVRQVLVERIRVSDREYRSVHIAKMVDIVSRNASEADIWYSGCQRPAHLALSSVEELRTVLHYTCGKMKRALCDPRRQRGKVPPHLNFKKMSSLAVLRTLHVSFRRRLQVKNMEPRYLPRHDLFVVLLSNNGEHGRRTSILANNADNLLDEGTD